MRRIIFYLSYCFLCLALFSSLRSCGNAVTSSSTEPPVVSTPEPETTEYSGEYDELINALRDELRGIDNVEMYSYSLYYAIHDINGDGVPELLLVTNSYFVHAVYTLVDGEAVSVGSYMIRYSCAIDSDGIFYIHASSGAGDWYYASYYLPPGSAQLTLIERAGCEIVPGYDIETGEGLPGHWYHTKDDVKTIVEYEEIQDIIDNFPGYYRNNPTQRIGLKLIRLYESREDALPPTDGPPSRG